MSKSVKSNQQIIGEISATVEPHMKFNMDDFYGDRGGIPYPEIESLDLLHFKYVGKTIISKNITDEKSKKILKYMDNICEKNNN
jgi:hypothetical protein